MRFLLLSVLVLSDLNGNFRMISGMCNFSNGGKIPTHSTTRKIYNQTYSSLDLMYLTNLENDLVPIIKTYVSKLNKEPEYFLKRYIADYETSSPVPNNLTDGTKEKNSNIIFRHNPLLSFRMVWRFVTDIPEIRNALLSSGDSEILDEYKKKIPPSIIWPNQIDLTQTIDDLLNMHHVYDLNLTEFTNGIIRNVVTHANLFAIHCIGISKQALQKNKQYTLALEWLEIAEVKAMDVNRHPILDKIPKASISKLYKNISTEHDAEWKEEPPHAYNLCTFNAKMDSEFILTSQKEILQLQHQRKGPRDQRIRRSPVQSVFDAAAFFSLCKGGNLQTEKEKSKLRCWYEQRGNPAWYINPQKMEPLNPDPYLVQVYDFIGDNLINYLKKETATYLERGLSDPNSTVPDRFIKTTSTISVGLNESEHAPRLTTLSQRIGLLTGLNPSWAYTQSKTITQITIYNGVSGALVGGFNKVHVDPIPDNDDISNSVQIKEYIGDRMATFTLHLNDVELGGQTAFTSIGVAVPPVKGSAVIFYNRKRTDEVDYRTWHAECPVLIGEKWLATKWIHSELNAFKRSCALWKYH